MVVFSFPRLTGGSSEQGDKCQDEILEVPGVLSKAVNHRSSPGRQRNEEIGLNNNLYVCLSSYLCNFFMNVSFDYIYILSLPFDRCFS